jgi:hypothetical protein
MCQLMQNSEEKLSEDITIIQQQDIQGNSKHLTQSRNITGGQCYDFDTKQVLTVKYFQVSSITSFKFKDNSECLLLGIV